MYENVQIMTNFSRGSSAEKVLKAVSLFELRNSKTSSLSAGERRRLTIAMVLATRPSLLILDEVTVGLDSNMKLMVWDAIQRLENCAIMAVSHDMHEIEALADDCCILHDGKIIKSASLDEVMDSGSYKYILNIFAEVLMDVPPDVQVIQKKACRCLLFNKSYDSVSILQIIQKLGLSKNEWVLETVRMESVFLETLTGKFAV